MRDIVVTLIILGAIPYILRDPRIGVLVWSWIGYMNPHKLCWTFARDMPFAQFVAIAMIVSLFMNPKQVKKPPVNAVTVFWWLFLGWMVVTTIFAVYPEQATHQLIKVMKIQLIVFITMLVMQSKERIDLMIWVIFLSIGYFGVKGGIFTFLTGGAFRVWGPPGFIEDNNYLAVALLMTIPLGYYLFQQVERKWIKFGLVAAMLLMGVSAVGTWSRGAFIAIIATGIYLWWKSKNKAAIGLLVLPLIPAMFLFMPSGWWDRMASIQEYDDDASATSRLSAWEYSINAANSRITGGGMLSWSRKTYYIWGPKDWNPTKKVFVAHSIYFSTIADHGWFGFFLWLMVYLLAFRYAGRLRAAARGDPNQAWVSSCMSMIQVSLVAYAVGGTFLSLTYFDLPWHLVAIVMLVGRVQQQTAGATSPESEVEAAPSVRRHHAVRDGPRPITGTR